MAQCYLSGGPAPLAAFSPTERSQGRAPSAPKSPKPPSQHQPSQQKVHGASLSFLNKRANSLNSTSNINHFKKQVKSMCHQNGPGAGLDNGVPRIDLAGLDQERPAKEEEGVQFRLEQTGTFDQRRQPKSSATKINGSFTQRTAALRAH